MAYCTTQDLIDRFTAQEIVQLSDHDGNGSIDQLVVDKAVADSDSEIDSFLRGRYPLPLLSIPPELNRVACDIARFYLYADQVTSIVDYRYKNALDYLKSVSSGRVTLPASVVDAGLPEKNNSGISVTDRKTLYPASVTSQWTI